MKLSSPYLNIDEEATNSLITSSINGLKEDMGAFAILAEDQMNYVQAMATEDGFVVQFQSGSIDEHYEFDNYLSRPQTITLFQAYLEKSPNWHESLKYTKIDLRGFWGRLGLIFGRFFGGLVRGFTGTRK